MNLPILTEQIKEKAHALGFELVGITPALPVPDFDLFLDWLDRGYAGTMDYLRRGLEKRGDPEKILPGVRSIICCGINYHTGQKRSLERKPDEAWISSYAWGEDYHDVVGEKLIELSKYVNDVGADPRVCPLFGRTQGFAPTKTYVDTGAILERSYAARAGLGWIGKNTCLINNGIGSFLFLGEILTTFELGYDRPTVDQCGSCTRCLDACPTGALVEPGVLDARRCISYLTIEHRGEIEAGLAKQLAGNVAGCDICQEVCPYNERIPVSREPAFLPREGLVAPKREALLGTKSPVPRIKQDPWERNLTPLLDNKAASSL